MAQWFVHVDSIAIAAALALLCEHSRFFEVLNNTYRCTFSDSDLFCYVSHPRRWIVCQAHQNMCVVTQKRPVPLNFLLF